MANETLNKIVSYIEDFATNHKQIKSFFFGDIWEYVGEKNDLFSVFTCTLTGGNLSKGVEGTTFQFGIFDYVAKDKANELAVLSDTKSIAKDFISYLSSPVFEDLKVDITTDLTDYSEKFNHQLSGWFFNVTIKQPFEVDLCSIPMTSIPVYPNQDIVTIYDYLGNVIATINPGQSYTVANQMVTITTTPYPTATGTTFACTDATKIIGVFFNTGRLNLTNDYTISGNNIVLNTAAANDYITIVEVA